MPYGFSAKQIDYLLYEYRNLRREIDLMLPHSSGICMVPPRGAQPGKPVEGVAIERAELSMVLDAVDRAVKSLPRDLKAVYAARYRYRLPLSQVAKVCHYSERSVDRKVTRIRAVVAGYLCLQNDAFLALFWRWLDASLVENVALRPQNKGEDDHPQKG